MSGASLQIPGKHHTITMLPATTVTFSGMRKSYFERKAKQSLIYHIVQERNTSVKVLKQNEERHSGNL